MPVTSLLDDAFALVPTSPRQTRLGTAMGKLPARDGVLVVRAAAAVIPAVDRGDVSLWEVRRTLGDAVARLVAAVLDKGTLAVTKLGPDAVALKLALRTVDVEMCWDEQDPHLFKLARNYGAWRRALMLHGGRAIDWDHLDNLLGYC